MRIGVDMRHVTEGPSGGIAPHLVGVFSHLFAKAPHDEFYLFGTLFNRGMFPDGIVNLQEYSLPIPFYWNEVDSFLQREKIDVLFRSYPDSDTLQFPLRKQIAFVPDLQHEQYPGFFSADVLSFRRHSFSRLIQDSGAVGTNSKHARSVIEASFRNAFNDVFLMPPAGPLDVDRANLQVSSSFRAKLQSLTPYLFFPANLWPHKNHAALLHAFKLFRTSSAAHGRFSLVLSGFPHGWEDISTRHDTTAVAHVGFVSRDEVAYLYRNAAALVFVSLYEGFGIPLLEAFGFGCPVLCSNTTSLPEVAGEAAILVDPDSPEKIAQSMATLADDEELRASLIVKGRQRFRAYSWEQSASTLGEAFRRVHERNLPVPIVVRDTGPLVSIVTPSYNQGKFIRRTIDSVVGQTYPRIEYRIIDGASTDNTLDVLRSYGDKLDWVSERDRGQTHAVNKGFSRSRGQIRAYLNSDDVLLPNAVEIIVGLFAREPEVSMFYGDAHYIDAEDRIIGKYATAEYSFDRLMHDCCVCQPAAFWTTKIAEKVGPFEESLYSVLDYDYWLRIDRTGGLIRFAPIPLACSRLHPETKTVSARGTIYAEIFEVCRRHGGYVSRNYIQGYWHHRFHEEPNWPLRVLRRIPSVEEAVVDYHSLRVGHPKLGHIDAMREVLRRATFRIRPSNWPRRRVHGIVPPTSRHVQGFWPDGWLTPVARFSSGAVKSGGTLRVRGRPAVDCRLEVRSGSDILLTEMLRAGIDIVLEFTAKGDDITLTFDAFGVDESGRRLAFLITQTNLFSEQEL